SCQRNAGSWRRLCSNRTNGADAGNAAVPDHFVVGGLDDGGYWPWGHECPAILACVTYRTVAQAGVPGLFHPSAEVIGLGVVVGIVDRIRHRDDCRVEHTGLVELA